MLYDKVWFLMLLFRLLFFLLFFCIKTSLRYLVIWGPFTFVTITVINMFLIAHTYNFPDVWFKIHFPWPVLYGRLFIKYMDYYTYAVYLFIDSLTPDEAFFLIGTFWLLVFCAVVRGCRRYTGDVRRQLVYTFDVFFRLFVIWPAGVWALMVSYVIFGGDISTFLDFFSLAPYVDYIFLTDFSNAIKFLQVNPIFTWTVCFLKMLAKKMGL